MNSLPPSGEFVEAIHEYAWKLEDFGIRIDEDAIKNLLVSPAFTQTFERLSQDLMVTLPLNFSTFSAELNVISIVSLLNFASGYRIPLRNATGRGAWDNIRYLVIAMYIDSTTGAGDLLSAKGMKVIDEQKISSLLNVSIREEKPHESIPGVTVGQLGGPLFEMISLIKGVLNETGALLDEYGYPDFGSFVRQAFEEGSESPGKACDVILERLVTTIPGLRDMSIVDGKRTVLSLLKVKLVEIRPDIYIFKKALFLILAVTKRFAKQSPPSLPLPDVSKLPAMSDNVVPSMLVYFGIINLEYCKFPKLRKTFPRVEVEKLLREPPKDAPPIKAEDLKEGPLLGSQETYVLRAAGVNACERVATIARELEVDPSLSWIHTILPSHLGMWFWSAAKDRPDYRSLPRFAERKTVFY